MGLMGSGKGLFGRENLQGVDRDCSFSDNASVRWIKNTIIRDGFKKKEKC